MSLRTRFDDGLGWGSVSGTLGGRRFSWFEKVDLNMHEGPNTSKIGEGWLGMKSKGFRRVSNFTWTQFESTSVILFAAVFYPCSIQACIL